VSPTENAEHRIYLARAAHHVTYKALEKGLEEGVESDVRTRLQRDARDSWAYVKTCMATLEAIRIYPPLRV
jgi:hypothetical protein